MNGEWKKTCKFNEKTLSITLSQSIVVKHGTPHNNFCNICVNKNFDFLIFMYYTKK